MIGLPALEIIKCLNRQLGKTRVCINADEKPRHRKAPLNIRINILTDLCMLHILCSSHPRSTYSSAHPCILSSTPPPPLPNPPTYHPPTICRKNANDLLYPVGVNENVPAKNNGTLLKMPIISNASTFLPFFSYKYPYVWTLRTRTIHTRNTHNVSTPRPNFKMS